MKRVIITCLLNWGLVEIKSAQTEHVLSLTRSSSDTHTITITIAKNT